MAELSLYLEAALRAGTWLASEQRPGGLLSVQEGVVACSKGPWALAVTGQVEAGNRLLDNMCQSFMECPGEFCPLDGSFEDPLRLRVYRNAGILVGAARLGRWDVASPAAADRLCAYQHPCGAFLANLDGSDSLANICQTAQAGWACVGLGRHQAARKAADVLVRHLELQPDPKRHFYFQFDTEKERPVTEIPPDQHVLYVLDTERSRQHIFHIGIAMAFLADVYSWTHQRCYLDAARGYFDFDARTNPEGYSWPSKGKVGWGAALLYRATGQEEYRKVAERVVEITYLKAQQTDGSWESFLVPLRDDCSGFEAKKVALTAEFAYELVEIVRGLSKQSPIV